jgi:hypothetical protein
MKLKLLLSALSIACAITYSTTVMAGSGASISQKDDSFSVPMTGGVSGWLSALLGASRTNAKVTSYPEGDGPACYAPDGKPIYLESKCQTLYPDPPPTCGAGTNKPCPIKEPCGRSCVVTVDPGP